MRSAYENYEIEQEWLKHQHPDTTEPDTRETIVLKNKMSTLSLNIKDKNSEIYRAKYGIKKLDKRIDHLHEKIKKLKFTLHQVDK